MMELRFRSLSAAIAGGLVAATMLNGSAPAADSRFVASLRHLDPDTRLEQVCDMEAMARIARDSRKFKPDRAKSFATKQPRHIKNVLRAPGAAFRSKGKWYKLSFVCTGSADRTAVVSFDYEIGQQIPEKQWAEYDLW
jgi:hypothetical protein